jgi:hypothetical protein
VASQYLEGKAWDIYDKLCSANPTKWTLSEMLDEIFNHRFSKDFKAQMRLKLRGYTQEKQSVFDYI